MVNLSWRVHAGQGGEANHRAVGIRDRKISSIKYIFWQGSPILSAGAIPIYTWQKSVHGSYAIPKGLPLFILNLGAYLGRDTWFRKKREQHVG